MRSIHRLSLVVLMLLGAATAASADVPLAGTSTIGTFIILGTTDGSGPPQPLVEKVMIIRDLGGVPVPGAIVEVRFGACVDAGEFRLCSAQSFPGMGILCADASVHALSGAGGRVTFRVRGHAEIAGAGAIGVPAPGLGDAPCAEVRADGVVLGYLRVKALDLDGRDGLTPADLSRFLHDAFNSTCTPYARPPCASYRSRTDLNDDGTVNPVDLSLFLGARFSSPGHTSCTGATCAP